MNWRASHHIREDRAVIQDRFNLQVDVTDWHKSFLLVLAQTFRHMGVEFIPSIGLMAGEPHRDPSAIALGSG
jgi:hypothetical protein